MKSLSFVLIFSLLLASSAHAGLPPATAQGQSDASPLVTFGLQARASQMTRTSATTALIEAGNRNVLSNPSFEATNYSSGWTVTTASASSESTTVVDGKRSMHLAFTASTGDVAQSLTPTTQTDAQNWEASCRVNTTASTIQVCALTGGAEVNCVSVPSTGKWGNVSANFIGPASGSVGIRVKTTGAITGDVFVDDCYVGPARNLSQVSQASLFGSVTTAPTASCSWNNTTVGSWQSYGVTAACPVATATASAQAPATKIPAITFPTLPPGEYYVVATGSFNVNAGTAADVLWRLTDGTSSTTPVEVKGPTAASLVAVPVITGRFSYSTAQSNITIQMQSDVLSGSSYGMVDATNAGFTISVYRFPTSSQTAYTADLTSASWSGYQTVTSGWGQTSTTLAAPPAGSGIVTTSLTNANVTCSSFGTAAGISCTLPRAGRYEVCADANYNPSASAYISSQLVDGSGVAITKPVDLYLPNARGNVPLCGQYNVSAAGTTSFQIYNAASSGTMTIVNGYTSGSPAINWTVKQLDASMPTPAIMGQISSNTSGQERVERVSVNTVCTSSPCTISKQSGSWLSSISWTATGNYTLNIAAGIFSDIPTCVGNTNEGTGRYLIIDNTSATATSVKLLTYLPTTNVAGNEAFNIICMGPR